MRKRSSLLWGRNTSGSEEATFDFRTLSQQYAQDQYQKKGLWQNFLMKLTSIFETCITRNEDTKDAKEDGVEKLKSNSTNKASERKISYYGPVHTALFQTNRPVILSKIM